MSDPMLTPPEISIVVPTFNEIDNLTAVIENVANAFGGTSWEIIFVDDDSPDGTAERAKQLARADSRIRCLHRVGRRGLAGACIEGMLSSSAPYVAMMDADLQHDASILPKMLESLRADRADLVVGSRLAGGGSTGAGFSRRRATISRFATGLARIALRSNIEDLMSGFFAIRRARFNALAPRLATSGFKLLADIVVSSDRGLRTLEIGYTFRPRQTGESKLDPKAALDFIGLLINKATRNLIPVRFVSFALVGVCGVIVHLAVLRTAMLQLPITGFAGAQAVATLVAMTTNFFLNNWLTYRDQKLRGAGKLLRGLLTFWLLCAFGAIANLGVASWVFGATPIWWLAGFAGLVTSAVWNYTLSSLFVWSRTN